ncbi:MAG: aldo/keto reductase [Candidatus Izimaplasma sp.]|nr:aldo/keto reductase [Candidatus Izimaplasma bacterium]
MYIADKNRYNKMSYNRVGKSGLKLPQLSLGLWQNFGKEKPFEEVKEIILKAFDNGITHFDLANNYGRPGGSAEENLGKLMANELLPYRDQIIISTKAGYGMWPGPYGDFGSRKYLMASIDQSLKRLNIKYVDIFYHHRPDYNTPLEETMKALADIVTQGKALYIGISNYPTNLAVKASDLLAKYGVKLLIHQPSFSMLNRWIQDTALDKAMEENGVGIIPYSVLSQGLLTEKYIEGIPDDSRVSNPNVPFVNEGDVTKELRKKLTKLKTIADSRGQTLAQLAISWTCIQRGISTVLIGVSKLSQLIDNLDALNKLEFNKDELLKIDKILKT